MNPTALFVFWLTFTAGAFIYQAFTRRNWPDACVSALNDAMMLIILYCTVTWSTAWREWLLL